MQMHLVIQEREVNISSKAPCLHLVETAPSVLRKMPWIILKEHMVRIQLGRGREFGVILIRELKELQQFLLILYCMCRNLGPF